MSATAQPDPQLMCGDCMELLKSLPDQSVDFVCCDPPYGITNAAWDKCLDLPALWTELERVITPVAMVALFASNRFLFDLVMSNKKHYRYRAVWVKNQAGNFYQVKVRPLGMFEDIVLFSQCSIYKSWYEPQKTTGHKPYRKLTGGGPSALYRAGAVKVMHENSGTRYPTDVLTYPAVAKCKRLHPTQKPVPLLEHLIKSYCPPGGTVLDFAMGSGSTGVAAANTGRRFIGMELDRDFFDIAAQRINNACTADKETYEQEKD